MSVPTVAANQTIAAAWSREPDGDQWTLADPVGQRAGGRREHDERARSTPSAARPRPSGDSPITT